MKSVKKILMSCVLACGGLTIMMGSDLFACGEMDRSYRTNALDRTNYVQEPMYGESEYETEYRGVKNPRLLDRFNRSRSDVQEPVYGDSSYKGMNPRSLRLQELDRSDYSNVQEPKNYRDESYDSDDSDDNDVAQAEKLRIKKGKGRTRSI